MLKALDAMVQNGSGGRNAIVLRHIYALLEAPPIAQDHGAGMLIDQIMMTLAQELDDESIAKLAQHRDEIQDKLPAFSGILTRNGGSSNRYANDPNSHADRSGDDVHLDFADSHCELIPAETITQDDDAKPLGKVFELDIADAKETIADNIPETLPPPSLTERRSRPRDPLEDMNNPITLARKASITELLEIASLPHLPESITNVLVARGDRDVLKRAIRNPTASFAKSSLTTLAELAPSDRMIRDALLARRDLPEAIIERLLPFLSSNAKAGILMSGASFGEQEAHNALRQATADLVAAYRSGQLLMGLDSCLSTLEEGRMTLNDIIVTLARDVRIAELAEFLASRAGIRQVTALNILSGRIDHAAAILLRALDTDLLCMDAVMTMRRRCGCREAKESRSAFTTGMRYSIEAANELLRLMDAIDQKSYEPSEHDHAAACDDMELNESMIAA